MFMSKKITIGEQFDEVIEILKANGYEAQAEFIAERKDKHNAKNANRKPTKVQTENEVLKEELLKGMEIGKTYTITDLIKSIPAISELTNQRVSALVRQLKENDLVVRTEVKGKAYFTKA